MKLRRFNEKGLQEFSQFLDALALNSKTPAPTSMLTDEALAVPVAGAEDLTQQTFKNRFDLAAYLDQVLSNVTGCEVERDAGLWAWLSLLFLDIVCPPDGNGHRKVRERARYVPAVSDFRKYYRHLLAGPYRVYRAHRQNPQAALVLLCGPIHKPGEIVEQIVARQEIITNPNAVSLATKIYYDPKTGSFRRGAASKSNGSVRRFADVLNQFDVTWDLYWMEPGRMLGKLPAEFEKFRVKAIS